MWDVIYILRAAFRVLDSTGGLNTRPRPCLIPSPDFTGLSLPEHPVNLTHVHVARSRLLFTFVFHVLRVHLGMNLATIRRTKVSGVWHYRRNIQCEKLITQLLSQSWPFRSPRTTLRMTLEDDCRQPILGDEVSISTIHGRDTKGGLLPPSTRGSPAERAGDYNSCERKIERKGRQRRLSGGSGRM